MNNQPPFELLESPPYCPNPLCPWHSIELAKVQARFRFEGSRPVTRFPYQTKRYRCGRCRKLFSDSIFYLFYRDRTEPTYEKIFRGHHTGKTRRETSLELGCSISTVQRRFRKLAAQSLLQHAKRSEKIKIREPIVYDGIENFSFSQYDPNNVNHAVGKESLFLYDFNFSPLNRKGRRTAAQKKVESQLEKLHGRYPSNAIREASERLIGRLLAKAEGNLQFYSDDHQAYPLAIAKLPERRRLVHSVISSRKARNYRNKLFAVNHCDLITRQNMPTFKRETIAFAKHSIGMIESFSIFLGWKNYMRTVFVKSQKKDPTSNTQTPAVRVGAADRRLTFQEFFRMRIQPTQVTLSEDWKDFIERRDRFSRRPIALM